MFSLMRKKKTPLTQINPKNRLTKKQKQKLTQKTQELKARIRSLSVQLKHCRKKYDALEETLEHAKTDVSKLEYSISQLWFEACAEICRPNNWHAAKTFDQAAVLYREWSSRQKESEAICAKGVVQVEKQLRDSKRKQKKLLIEISAIERRISTTQSELNTIQKI